MPRRNLQKTSQSRLFTIEDRAAPSHVPTYQALARPGAVTWAQGDITPVRVPDPKQYGNFIVVDKIRGQKGLPSMPLEFRTTRDLSDILALVRKGCPIDIQLHIGACKDPSDFDGGWEKIIVLENADVTNYATGDLGAFDADQNAPVMETITVMGDDYYEIKPLAFSELDNATIIQNVVAVTICDAKTCGACGIPSDGCQHVFAISTPIGASPGLTALLAFTADGGATFGSTHVTTLPANLAPSAMTCVGPYLAVASNTDLAVHYALINDILAGTETWTRIATGLVTSKGINKMVSLARNQTWAVANGGYIYFSSDIGAGFSTQQAGDITVQNLLALTAFDEENLLAGGASNVVLNTKNGGLSWTAITGPSGQAGVSVTAVAMISELEWIIGYADGTVFVTGNGGATWTQKLIPGSLTAIDDIQFSNRTVGYIAGHTATTAKILRTVSGGNSWYVLPETVGLTVPTAVQYNSLAPCVESPNIVWAGGLRVTSGDGILIKGA